MAFDGESSIAMLPPEFFFKMSVTLTFDDIINGIKINVLNCVIFVGLPRGAAKSIGCVLTIHCRSAIVLARLYTSKLQF